MSINDYTEKIKGFIQSDQGKDVLVILIVILVGLGSFELGRLSKDNDSIGLNNNQYQTGSVLAVPDTNMGDSGYSNSNASESISATNSSENYFASKTGKKYYPVGCAAGKTIKDINKVWFTTSAAAEKAGYAPSSAC